jgi:hypothetical protein
MEKYFSSELSHFRQCAAYQKDKNLDRFVSIVVLDEIGLAEDSPKMPLKVNIINKKYLHVLS